MTFTSSRTLSKMSNIDTLLKCLHRCTSWRNLKIPCIYMYMYNIDIKVYLLSRVDSQACVKSEIIFRHNTPFEINTTAPGLFCVHFDNCESWLSTHQWTECTAMTLLSHQRPLLYRMDRNLANYKYPFCTFE